MENLIQKIGLIAAVALPFWNIPLVVHIWKRKSSRDISLTWALGVWSCLALMAPSGFTSKDLVWRAFNFSNFGLFSLVVVTILAFRKR